MTDRESESEDFEEGGEENSPTTNIPLSDRHTQTYLHAVEDARRTHTNQLEAYNDINEKAWRIVQLNGVVATIFVAAISRPNTFNNPPSCTKVLYLLGGTGLVVSTLFAIVGQRSKRVNLGPESEFFKQVRNLNSPETEYLLRVLEGYENWTDDLRDKTENNGDNVSVSMYMLLFSIGLILAGTLIGLL